MSCLLVSQSTCFKPETTHWISTKHGTCVYTTCCAVKLNVVRVRWTTVSFTSSNLRKQEENSDETDDLKGILKEEEFVG